MEAISLYRNIVRFHVKVAAELFPADLNVCAEHQVGAIATFTGRLLTFALAELRQMPKGGRGLMLMGLEDKDTLVGAAAYTRSIRVEGTGRGGKAREEVLEIRSLNNAAAARGRKGKAANWGFKPQRIERVE